VLAKQIILSQSSAADNLKGKDVTKLNKEQQKGILITAAIAFLTLAIGIKIIYQPQSSEATKLKAQIRKETEKNSLIKELISRQNEFKKQQQRFSPKSETAWLEDKLRQATNSLNIELLEIEPLISEEASDFVPLGVRVKVKANYPTIAKLVSHLENLPELIEIKKIKMSSLSSRDWDKLAQSAEETVALDTRRQGQISSRKEKKEKIEGPKIDPAILESILNKSKEVEATLEVSTYYVR
jgi:Tfp pilus assembly protein PilO